MFIIELVEEVQDGLAAAGAISGLGFADEVGIGGEVAGEDEDLLFRDVKEASEFAAVDGVWC